MPILYSIRCKGFDMARIATGADSLTPEERSALMSKVRFKGNKSTEGVLVNHLVSNSIDGWICHPAGVLGRPDFFFLQSRSLSLWTDAFGMVALNVIATYLGHEQSFG